MRDEVLQFKMTSAYKLVDALGVYSADFTCAGETMDRALQEYGWSINLRQGYKT